MRMAGNPGRPGNGSLGMKTLLTSTNNIFLRGLTPNVDVGLCKIHCCVMNWILTGKFADKPTHGQSTCRLDYSRTSTIC